MLRLVLIASLVSLLLSGDSHSLMKNNSVVSATAPVRYRIDSSKSRFIVRAFVGGLFSAFGHDHTIAIRDIIGEAAFEPGSFQGASLTMTIRADSLAVIDKVSDKDRREIEATMRNEVLETGKFPEIVFRSTKITVDGASDAYQVKIWGDLTLHGVTRSGLINAKMTVDESQLRARGEFPLRQTDYKIKPVSVAAGTIKVKDELKLTFEIVAVKA
jgi:polyisoprenoid-binding protein YceI